MQIFHLQGPFLGCLYIYFLAYPYMANTLNSILLLVLQEHLDLTVQSYFLEVTPASRVRPCFLALLVIIASNYSLAHGHLSTFIPPARVSSRIVSLLGQSRQYISQNVL